MALAFGTNTLVATDAAGTELARTSFDVACLAGARNGSAGSRLRYTDLLFGFASENGYTPAKLEGADCASLRVVASRKDTGFQTGSFLWAMVGC